MKLLVTIPKGKMRDTFMPPEVMSRIEAFGDVIWNDTEKNWSNEEIQDKLIDVDICICGWGGVSFQEDTLSKANRLKIIAHTGGTAAHVATEAVFQRGIKVISGNWFFAQSLAEGTLAYILSGLRDIPYYNQEVQEGRWHDGNYYNESIFDQTIGLVGFGMTAQILVELLRPFHVKIKVFSEHKTDEIYEKYNVERATLEEVATTCKIISIHMAQREDTYHMFHRDLLKKIPDGVLLINTARGSLIDEEALAEELATGRLKAVLDVYEVEPLPEHSKLRGLNNVILIPHMGGPTIDRRKYCTHGILDDIERWMNGSELRYDIPMDYANRMTRQHSRKQGI